MGRLLTTCLLAVASVWVAAAPAMAAEPGLPAPADAVNLLKNGDFEKAGSGWRGDRKVIEDPLDPTNHVAAVTTRKTQERVFEQDLDIDADTGPFDIHIEFRVRASDDYKAGKISLHFSSPQSGNSGSYDLTGGGIWKFKTRETQISKASFKRVYTVKVDVEEAEAGTVYFDDFKLTATPTPSP